MVWGSGAGVRQLRGLHTHTHRLALTGRHLLTFPLARAGKQWFPDPAEYQHHLRSWPHQTLPPAVLFQASGVSLGNLYFLKSSTGASQAQPGGEPQRHSTRCSELAPNLLWGLGPPEDPLWAPVAQFGNPGCCQAGRAFVQASRFPHEGTEARRGGPPVTGPRPCVQSSSCATTQGCLTAGVA